MFFTVDTTIHSLCLFSVTLMQCTLLRLCNIHPPVRHCFHSVSAGQSKSIEDMDMNVVRLCFQCELERDDGDRIPLSPIVSNPIFDKSKSILHNAHTLLLSIKWKYNWNKSHADLGSVIHTFVCLCVCFFTEATTTSELKISRLNIVKGPCTGKTEIYMLCDKVQKGLFLFGCVQLML